MHLFHLTLTNLELILPLEEKAIFSALTSALLGGRRTADGQNCLHSDQRVFSRVGIDGDRRQEPVSPLFEMLRDDNVRRLCDSFVGANGRSPEKDGWNLCLLREKRDYEVISPLFSLSSSRERCELSDILILGSCKR